MGKLDAQLLPSSRDSVGERGGPALDIEIQQSRARGDGTVSGRNVFAASSGSEPACPRSSTTQRRRSTDNTLTSTMLRGARCKFSRISAERAAAAAASRFRPLCRNTRAYSSQAACKSGSR